MKLDHLDQLRRQEREILFELENEEEARDRLNDKKLPYILEARLTSVQRIIMLRSILRRLRAEIAAEEMMIKVASFHDERRGGDTCARTRLSGDGGCRTRLSTCCRFSKTYIDR